MSKQTVAWIDLSTKKVSLQPPDPSLTTAFLGGRGLGAALLFRHIANPNDPFAPENPLIFAVGPFTGTPWPTGARYHVTFHSPLTGIYGYANGSGFFGPALRRAGYQALVITGRAERPVYLEVTPEGIAIRPAEHLWGLGTVATHEALETNGARVACIGPAGERGVRIAAIINDRGRAAARCGGGAVMGSKNLKAIQVRGRSEESLPFPFLEQARRAFAKVRDHPNVVGLRDWGTVVLVKPKNRVGDLPARNHQLGQVPWAERVDAQAIARYTYQTKGCFSCPIRCSRLTRIENGPYAGELEGPEYETTDALGPMCWISDPEVIIHANRMCNDFGLDTISTGVVIAFAMECHERGLLHSDDLSLEWGDANAVLGLIERIARREGLGDLLSEGIRRAAERIGGNAPHYAMHVKGMELPRQEPRIAKGFGLGHATSNRGADHLYALPTIDLAGNLEAARHFFPAELVPQLMETDNEAYKPDLVVFTEHYCAVSDALGICKFSTAETYALYPEDLASGLSALWKREISSAELLKAGERIVNLERLYNVRLGLSRADDRLPTRFLTEPLEIYAFTRDEVTGGVYTSPEPLHVGRLHDFEAMLDRYYSLRGWDKNGIPTPETVRRLGLEPWISSL
ncbi:MAG: aldehyde ferredoxin oxidoreductase family protein [Chloroflexi bacterium]|nr:aldehyde ferredoxin oxidoreductase family protein [Chloroflexota bacterium]